MHNPPRVISQEELNKLIVKHDGDIDKIAEELVSNPDVDTVYEHFEEELAADAVKRMSKAEKIALLDMATGMDPDR